MSELPLPAVIGWLVCERCGGYDAETKINGHMQHIPPDRVAEAATFRNILQNQPPERVRRIFRDRLLELIPEASAAALDRESLLFFNRPAALPNHRYWAVMPIWSIEEATALLLGRDPRVVNWPAFEQEGVTATPFAVTYRNLANLIHRSVIAGVLNNPLDPSLCLDWYQQLAMPVSPDLVEEVESASDVRTNWQQAYSRLFKMFQQTQNDNAAWAEACDREVADHAATRERLAELETFAVNTLGELDAERAEHAAELEALQAEHADMLAKELDTRERASLLKLLIAAAIDCYGYNPLAAKNTATSDLVSATERRGIPVSDETIRKYLKEAAELLPPDAKAGAA